MAEQKPRTKKKTRLKYKGVKAATFPFCNATNAGHKKVEKHNQVIDRVYKLEQADAVEEEEIKVINHRISDLEQYHK